MRVHGMNLVWYRPHPKGYSESNRPPDKPSKLQHLFGGPNAPDSLCGKWLKWCPPKCSQPKAATYKGRPVARCSRCEILLRRLRSRPVAITFKSTTGRVTYRRALNYQLYKTGGQ